MSPQHNPTKVDLAQLIGLSEQARSLQLGVRRVRTRLAGQYMSPAKGRGMEFSESRPYQPGDDVRNIDWRVTARSGKTHTKLFQEEQERPVLISVDVRAPMFFATRGRFKSVLAAELAATVAWAGLQKGDRVGGELHWENGHREYRPMRGKRSLLHLLQGLANAQQQVSSSAVVSMEPALKRMRRIARAGSLVCVISDFRGFDYGAESQLVHIARHCDLLLLHVFDPLEKQLPKKGRYAISDGGRRLFLNADDRKFQAQYVERASARHACLQQFCSQRNLPYLQCATDADGITLLQQLYGKQRKRA